MSLLLDKNIWARFSQQNVVIGLMLLAIGLIVAIFAKKFTKMVRKSNKVEPNDKVLLVLKAFALTVILVSLIVMVIE